MTDPDDLADRLEDWPYGKPAFSKSECLEAAARLRHLDRILDGLLDAIEGEAEWIEDSFPYAAGRLRRIANAVRDTDRDET